MAAQRAQQSEEYQNFEALVRKLVTVPKPPVEKKKAAPPKKRGKRSRRKAD